MIDTGSPSPAHDGLPGKAAPRIYLASASPRRHQLLKQIGVAHDVLDIPAPPGDDEPQWAGESPQDYVIRTARDKSIRALAWCIQGGLPARPILTADTCVILDDAVLHKPRDHDDAAAMLARLSGRTHEVRTAVVVADSTRTLSDVAVTAVTFKTLNQNEIERYCASDEPMGKAGAYGIQGLGGTLIVRIEGSYTGVMGLPIYETASLLQQFGLTLP